MFRKMFIEIIYINNNINNKSYYKRIDVSKCVMLARQMYKKRVLFATVDIF